MSGKGGRERLIEMMVNIFAHALIPNDVDHVFDMLESAV